MAKIILLLLCLTSIAIAKDPIRPLPLSNISIDDRFWTPRLEIYRTRTIPHSWQYVQNEIRTLRRAAGENVPGELTNTWGEANLYKLLQTCALSLQQHPDPDLEAQCDQIITILAKAQRPDGFSHAFYIVNHKVPWDPDFLDGSHTGYVLGHMIQAALDYHAATGKRAFLDIAAKAADQAANHFLGPPAHPGFDGHAELEMALVELYRVVPNPRYLELAKAFIEWRGRGKVKPAGPTPRAYFQDHVPLRDQKTLDGHAVRAIFFATGVAEVARESRETDYILASARFFDCVALRRMTITGSIGPRKEHEALGEDYELPNNGYYESCAACGLADFAHRMFLLSGRSDAMDVLEQTLYNAILHGISLDGVNSYYTNPLTDKDNPRYNSWVCCPPNLSRTLLGMGRYAYAYSADELYLNLYLAGAANVPLSPQAVSIRTDTDYPWSGRVKIVVQTPARFTLHLRLPAWCQQAALTLNGKAVEPLPRDDSGYLTLTRNWTGGDVVELNMEMPVQRIEAHPNIQDCRGRIALMRGPLVYAFESLDNPGNADPMLAADATFQAERRADLLNGITLIKSRSANGSALTAIPFYALANRGKASQLVWVKQQGLAPSVAWWEGKLYRPVLERRQ